MSKTHTYIYGFKLCQYVNMNILQKEYISTNQDCVYRYKHLLLPALFVVKSLCGVCLMYDLISEYNIDIVKHALKYGFVWCLETRIRLQTAKYKLFHANQPSISVWVEMLPRHPHCGVLVVTPCTVADEIRAWATQRVLSNGQYGNLITTMCTATQSHCL